MDEFARISSEPLEAEAVANRKTFLIGGFQRQLQTGAFERDACGRTSSRHRAGRDAGPCRPASGGSGPAATAALGRILRADRISLVIVGDSAKFIDKVRALRPDTVVVPVDKLDTATGAAGGAAELAQEITAGLEPALQRRTRRRERLRRGRAPQAQGNIVAASSRVTPSNCRAKMALAAYDGHCSL